MRSNGLVIRYLLTGAIAFWFPDVVLNALRVNSLFLFTFLPVLGLLGGYLLARAVWRSVSGPSTAIFMLLGVWLSASTAMMVGASFYGGGFARGSMDTLGVIVLGLVPPYTLIMAAYDGSLFGLLLGSFLMLGAHCQFEIDHWVLTPTIRNKLIKWYEHRVS